MPDRRPLSTSVHQELTDAVASAAITTAASTAPSQPSAVKSTLTLFQANLLVAVLGGFWVRQADGHPGPRLMARGLLMLSALVEWESIRKQRPRENAPGKQPGRKPG